MTNSERFGFKYEFEWERNPYPGLFIVVEGLDGSGNTTQITKLANEYFYDWEGLTGGHVLVEKEPTFGPWGAPVNFALRRKLQVDDQTLQLGFTTDRSDHIVQGGLVEHLKTPGNVLLMDRYVASTVAFGYSAGMDINYLIALQSKFILPDLMFFIDTPVDECIKRIEKRKKRFVDNDRYEKEKILTEARAGYVRFGMTFPGLVHKIDGKGSIAAVSNEIVSVIEQHPKRYTI